MTALEYKSNIKLYILMLMLGIGIYITISMETGVSSLVWLLIGCLYLLKSRNNESVLMLIFVIPFEMWLPVNELFFLAFMVEILKEKKASRIFIWLAMLFSTILMQSIISTYGKVSIILKILIVWMAFLYFVCKQISDNNLFRICQAFRWGAIIYSIDIFCISWKYAGRYILESRLGGGQLAPYLPEYIEIPSENVIGLVMAVALIITMLEMYYTGRKKYICLIWFAAIGILTKSTTFLVLFIIINCWYYIYFSPRNINCILQMGAELLILGVALITIYRVYPDFFGYFISRFSLADKSNGRNIIFQAFNQNFIKGNIWNILFGYGTQNLDIMGNGGGLHNGMQGWYIQYGLAGFLLISIMLIMLIRNGYVKKYSKESFCVSVLPLLTMLIGIQTMNVSFIWYLPVLIILNLSKIGRRKGSVYYNNRGRICQ